MDSAELKELRESKMELLKAAEQEHRKLRKKFKSSAYDRQVICEFIISTQTQIKSLIATIERINGILEGKLSTAQS